MGGGGECEENQPKVFTYELGDDSGKRYYQDVSIAELPLEECWSSIYAKHMKNYVRYNDKSDTIKGKLNIYYCDPYPELPPSPKWGKIK